MNVRLPKRFLNEVWWFGHAVNRVSSEIKDIQRYKDGELTLFCSIVYIKPITVAQRMPFLDALSKAAGSRVPTEGDWLNVAVPREAGAFAVKVECVTADQASMMILTLVRDALHATGIETTEIRVETIPDE